MKLKESKKLYMGGLGGRKEKGEILKLEYTLKNKQMKTKTSGDFKEFQWTGQTLAQEIRTSRVQRRASTITKASQGFQSTAMLENLWSRSEF